MSSLREVVLFVTDAPIFGNVVVICIEVVVGVFVIEEVGSVAVHNGRPQLSDVVVCLSL